MFFDAARADSVQNADWYSAVMTSRLVAGTAVAMLFASLPPACTAVVTYPPTAGKSALTPNVTPGPEIMAAALREAHRTTGADGALVFNLPDGLNSHAWSRVTALLPSGARAMRPGDADVLSVQQLRLTGGQAEVDVLFPDRGVYQLMTVTLDGGSFLPWKVKYAHRWVIPCTPPIANDPSIEVLASEGASTPADASTQE